MAKNILPKVLSKKGENMTDISFGSTFRIPISQAGVNNAKKLKLRDFINSYPNGLIGNSKLGYARVSVADKEDCTFIAKLKNIGYKIFERFQGENISKENLDTFIKEKLDARNYNKIGTSPKRMSKEMKDKRRYDRRYTPPKKNEVSEEVEPLIVETQSAQFEQPKSQEDKFSLNEKIKTLIKGTDNYKRRESEFGKDYADNSLLKPQVSYKEKMAEKEKARIRQLPKYIELKEKYGEDFAEAVYFGIK